MYKKRSIAALVSIFALGVVFGIFMSNHDTFSFRAVFAIITLSTLVFLGVNLAKDNISSKRIKAVTLLVAAFSFGVLRVSVSNEIIESYDKYNHKSEIASFEIVEPNQTYYDVKVIESTLGIKNGTRLRLYAGNTDDKLISGDEITAEVRYKGAYKTSLFAKSLRLTASGEIIETKEGNGLLYTIRRSVSENSDEIYSRFEYAPAISKGVTVGDRSDIDTYVFSVYKASGLSHILAISGLHITLIAMSLHSILSAFAVNRKLNGILTSLVAIAYTALVGFTAGAVRSAVMLLAIMLARTVMRRADGITSLFVALFLLLLVNPHSIASVGLQLSFLCSLGIILINPLVSNFNGYCSIFRYKSRGIKRVLLFLGPIMIAPLCISFVSSIFSFPVLCVAFDTVSYISPLANIACVPLFSFAVKLALVSYIVAPISMSLATLIGYPAGVIFDLVTNISKLVYDNDFGNMSVYLPFMVIPVLLSLAMIAALVFLSRCRIKVFVSFAVAFCISLLALGVYNEYLCNSKTILEYNNQTSEYVYFQTIDKNCYVDLDGFISEPEAIFKNGRTSLDEYVMLNFDDNSLKRFDYISGNVRIREIHLPNPTNSYEMGIFSQIKALANKRNCVIIKFGDYYSSLLSANSEIEVVGTGEAPSDETLVCINHNGMKIRVLTNGYDNAVNCDIAILTESFEGDFENLLADEILISKDASSDESIIYDHRQFENLLKIKFDKSESEFVIYEH